MTKENALKDFIGTSDGFNDYWEMQQSWETYKDGLARDGQISQEQADNWDNPCSPETFKAWNSRHYGKVVA